MGKLQDERIVVTGGSHGLGLGIVEALLARGAQVTVVARDPARLAEVERLGAAARTGDVTDPALMGAVVADVKPSVLILNAGATPFMAPIDEQTWDAFTAVWDTDVKAGLYGIQAALNAPLSYGSRVLVASSGAAIAGNPLSGGYAGAKRMLWIMAHYANGLASERELGIHFQVLVPQQIVAETALGGRQRHGSTPGPLDRGVAGRTVWHAAAVAPAVRRARRDASDRSALRDRCRLRLQGRRRHHGARRLIAASGVTMGRESSMREGLAILVPDRDGRIRADYQFR
jgi:NAD(P)-dependent dehydrogenase (short-subunit alcohol dehydrogenase family)